MFGLWGGGVYDIMPPSAAAVYYIKSVTVGNNVQTFLRISYILYWLL